MLSSPRCILWYTRRQVGLGMYNENIEVGDPLSVWVVSVLVKYAIVYWESKERKCRDVTPIWASWCEVMSVSSCVCGGWADNIRSPWEHLIIPHPVDTHETSLLAENYPICCQTLSFIWYLCKQYHIVLCVFTRKVLWHFYNAQLVHGTVNYCVVTWYSNILQTYFV